jgi:hypothetical protein
MLGDQSPPLQFSGDQYFSNFWSCVHLFDFLQQNGLRSPLSTMIAAGLRTDISSNDGNSVGLAT